MKLYKHWKITSRQPSDRDGDKRNPTGPTSSSVRSLSTSPTASLCRAAPVLFPHSVLQDFLQLTSSHAISLQEKHWSVQYNPFYVMIVWSISFTTHLAQTPQQMFFLILFICNVFSWGISTSFPAQRSLKDCCAEENVSPLQCRMNGACTWPNFLIWVVKINSKIITHVPKYWTGYQSTQLQTGTHKRNWTHLNAAPTNRILTSVWKGIDTDTCQGVPLTHTHKYMAGGGEQCHSFHLEWWVFEHPVCPCVHLYIHSHTIAHISSLTYAAAEVGNINL